MSGTKKDRWRRLPRWSMQAMFVGVTIVCVVFGLLMSALGNSGIADEPQNIELSIAELIEQLDDNKFGIREAATKALGKRGAEGLEEIDRAFLQSSLEAQTRMFYLLERLSERKETEKQTRTILEKISKSKSTFAGRAGDVLDPYPRILEWIKSLSERRFGRWTVKDLRAATELDLSDTKITDQGLEHLSSLTALAELDLRNTKITDQGLRHLVSLTALTKLDLYNTKITDEGLKHLSNLTALTHVNLGATNITDKGLKHIGSLTALTWLYLCGTKFTDQGLEHLSDLTDLETLFLGYTKITDEGLKHLSDLTALTSLDLRYTKITDEGVKHLSSLTALTSLYLSDTKITDEGLKHLGSLTALTSLWLRDTKITDQGLTELKKALPNCIIASDFDDN